MLTLLAERSVNEVHLEAGAMLNGAFLEAGLVDEILLYTAPCLFGSGKPIATFWSQKLQVLLCVGTSGNIRAWGMICERFYLGESCNVYRYCPSDW